MTYHSKIVETKAAFFACDINPREAWLLLMDYGYRSEAALDVLVEWMRKRDGIPAETKIVLAFEHGEPECA